MSDVILAALFCTIVGIGVCAILMGGTALAILTARIMGVPI